MVSLFYFSRKLCRENVISSRRTSILNRGLLRTLAFMRRFLVVVVLCVVIYFVVPVKEALLDNVWPLFIPLEMIIDISTTSGYIIANGIQSILGVYADLQTILYGTTFACCICIHSFIVDLIEEDFKDLDEMHSGGSNVPLAYRRAFLKNILLKQQDINK